MAGYVHAHDYLKNNTVSFAKSDLKGIDFVLVVIYELCQTFTSHGGITFHILTFPL